MRIVLTLLFFITSVCNCFSQQNENKKQNVFRLNFINPGLEYEYSISDRSKFATNIGVGLSYTFPNTTAIQPNINQTFISPFVDLHYKNIYNFDRRIRKNKSIRYNSGDFIGLKLNGRGKTIYSDVTRTDNIDFSFGPTWGLQRSYDRINFLFNAGPVYYFDTKGNNGFYYFPVFELSLGYNILGKER